MQESLSLMVSVDVKHHVYLLAVAVFKLLMDDHVPATNSAAVGRLQGEGKHCEGLRKVLTAKR